LREKGYKPVVVDRQTKTPDDIIRQADIVISAVGREGVINENNIKKGSILIGVGILKDGNESLQGDYNEDVIKNIAAAYTPTPGGVGPLNVAYLLSNLIEATK
jgi:methylenetetrahydrofolate dehydrogenase (NADP+)/methenyltetrahydrofolate cyclohydrolase